MDRSLKFFTSVNSQINGDRDTRTGFLTSNHTVTYNVNRYDPNNEQSTTQETQRVNYTVLHSIMNEEQFVNYGGNANTNDYRVFDFNAEHESDIHLPSIIEWTNDKTAMKLKNVDFAYLKQFRVYPANRMMVLRRFPSAPPDNLFNCTMKPINTVISYYDPEKMPISISFNEKWKSFDKSFMDVLQDVIGIKFDSMLDKFGLKSSVDSMSGSNLGQELFTMIGQKLGIINGNDFPFGDPNLVYEAAIRDVSGEIEKAGESASGLKSEIKIEFETTYVLRDINGVDSRAAMLDILANCVEMGTSPSRFIVTGNFASNINRMLQDLEQGNTDQFIDDVISGMSEIGQKIQAALSGAVDKLRSADNPLNAIISSLKDLAQSVIKVRLKRYKWQLKGAVMSLSGGYTAPWHVTLGNPKCPWLCIGNLVLDKCDMNVGTSLGYNDMFTELTVKYTLKSGRTLGGNEIASLFNFGRGRIYDAPDKVQTLYVPNDTDYHTPGRGDESSNNTTTTTTTDVTENTDQTNQINGTSNFGLGNTDTDPNLPK